MRQQLRRRMRVHEHAARIVRHINAHMHRRRLLVSLLAMGLVCLLVLRLGIRVRRVRDAPAIGAAAGAGWADVSAGHCG